MREVVLALSLLCLIATACTAWDRVQDDLARPDSTIIAANREGAQRFVEAPSTGTAASWGLDVIVATLLAALGATQYRDRNARRKVEDLAQQLALQLAALTAKKED